MPVVSNTSPLLNLAIIDHLFLLPQQFGLVFIPQTVLAELKIDQNLPGSSALRTALNEGWLIPQSVARLEPTPIGTGLPQACPDRPHTAERQRENPQRSPASCNSQNVHAAFCLGKRSHLIPSSTNQQIRLSGAIIHWRSYSETELA